MIQNQLISINIENSIKYLEFFQLEKLYIEFNVKLLFQKKLLF